MATKFTKTITISHFNTKEVSGQTVMYFDKYIGADGNTYYRTALIHPAIRYANLSGQTREVTFVQDASFRYETMGKNGKTFTREFYKVLDPQPTAEELMRYEQTKAEQLAKVEATAEDLAKVSF